MFRKLFFALILYNIVLCSKFYVEVINLRVLNLFKFCFKKTNKCTKLCKSIYRFCGYIQNILKENYLHSTRTFEIIIFSKYSFQRLNVEFFVELVSTNAETRIFGAFFLLFRESFLLFIHKI